MQRRRDHQLADWLPTFVSDTVRLPPLHDATGTLMVPDTVPLDEVEFVVCVLNPEHDAVTVTGYPLKRVMPPTL